MPRTPDEISSPVDPRVSAASWQEPFQHYPEAGNVPLAFAASLSQGQGQGQRNASLCPWRSQNAANHSSSLNARGRTASLEAQPKNAAGIGKTEADDRYISEAGSR
jgi:hypothetical protein